MIQKNNLLKSWSPFIFLNNSFLQLFLKEKNILRHGYWRGWVTTKTIAVGMSTSLRSSWQSLAGTLRFSSLCCSYPSQPSLVYANPLEWCIIILCAPKPACDFLCSIFIKEVCVCVNYLLSCLLCHHHPFDTDLFIEHVQMWLHLPRRPPRSRGSWRSPKIKLFGSVILTAWDWVWLLLFLKDKKSC